MDQPLIALRGVSHRAGDRLVLHDIDWTIAANQSWAVLGANGSGKSMLMRIVGGWLWPNAGGEVARLGSRLTDLSQLRRSIGWVSATILPVIPRAERALDTVVSGRFAQLGLQPTPWDKPNNDDWEKSHHLLGVVQASHLAERRFGELSQGEQQKVMLARAQMALPMMLILDEPCAGLDPGSRESFLIALGRVLEDDDAPGVIMVTHHLEEILPGMNQSLVLADGRVVSQGPTQELVDEELLHQIYGRTPKEIRHSGGRRWPIW